MRSLSRRSALLLATCAAVACVSSVCANHWVKALKVRGGAAGTSSSVVAGTKGAVAEEEPTQRLESQGSTEEQILAASFTELLGPDLLTGTDGGETDAVDTAAAVKGKHIALYFTSKAIEDQILKQMSNDTDASSSNTLKSAATLKAVYTQAKADGNPLEIVYVPVQDTADQTMEVFKDMPWLSIVPNTTTTINLIRKAGVTVLPSVVVVDPQGEVVTRDGYSNMAYYPDDFPWKNKNLRQILGDKFEKADGTTVGQEALTGKVLGLYFSADWCAPCKQFTPILTEAYNAIKASGKEIEIVYVGNDKTEEEQKKYVSKMPWLAIPYNSRDRAIVPRVLGVQGLPTLLFFDEDNKLITANGRTDVIKDAQNDTPGASFPYTPKLLSDLSDNPEYLARGPSLVVFMDGADKKEQARLMNLLQTIADERAATLEAAMKIDQSLLNAPRKVAFLAATEIDQLSIAIRKLCNLDEIQGKWKYMKSKKHLMKPKLALVSIVEGRFKVSEAEELTAVTVKSFLAEYDATTLEMDKFQAAGADDAEGENEDNDEL